MVGFNLNQSQSVNRVVNIQKPSNSRNIQVVSAAKFHDHYHSGITTEALHNITSQVEDSKVVFIPVTTWDCSMRTWRMKLTTLFSIKALKQQKNKVPA